MPHIVQRKTFIYFRFQVKKKRVIKQQIKERKKLLVKGINLLLPELSLIDKRLNMSLY